MRKWLVRRLAANERPNGLLFQRLCVQRQRYLRDAQASENTGGSSGFFEHRQCEGAYLHSTILDHRDSTKVQKSQTPKPRSPEASKPYLNHRKKFKITGPTPMKGDYSRYCWGPGKPPPPKKSPKPCNTPPSTTSDLMVLNSGYLIKGE